MKDMSNIVYWYKNQVVITYHSQTPVNASNDAILNTIAPHEQTINDQLHQDQTPYQLRRAGQNGMAGQSTDAAHGHADSIDLDGIYLFPTPTTATAVAQREALIAVRSEEHTSELQSHSDL